MQYDVILVTGEYYVDHPLSATGVLKRILESGGFSVGLIEKPNWKSNDDFTRLDKPRLFFGVTSGCIDSMLVNFTPLKKERSKDRYKPYESGIPNRAITVYCNKLREVYKDSKIVIGGIESSMRRFTHYDYWDNKLRRSILLDTRANILVYGPGEYQILEIAKRMNDNTSINGIDGTCIISNELPEDFIEINSHEMVVDSKEAFCDMENSFTSYKNIAQKCQNRYVLQYKMHMQTTKELDHIYNMPYSRDVPKYFPEFKMIQFSVVTHRGCSGNCNFCSISLHQGHHIVSRSEESIINEIMSITKHKDFCGNIDDLGGPSANMYGTDCRKCNSGRCLTCDTLDRSHKRIIALMKRAREVNGVKHVFVRSGIRYDLAVSSEEYIKEISNHHVSVSLKIAPEHTSPQILELMNKNTGKFEAFRKIFDKYNSSNGQYLKYYFMTAHPGSDMKEVRKLANDIKRLRNTESIQIFTPTPMTKSTAMYYTSLDLKTKKAIYVPYTYNEKKKQKNLLYDNVDD